MLITQLAYKEDKVKKIFILVLMVLVGISLIFVNLRAEEARTIPYKTGVAKGARTVIVTHGGTLYRVTGYASSANAIYGIYDASAITSCGTIDPLVEGGEATQYDSLATLDFGSEGIPFNTGLTIMTTTAYVNVIYR